ncbi:MAG: HAE1 family hydrophobic/amphiphilic exporter-1, partial [Bacteroidia bacterium]
VGDELLPPGYRVALSGQAEELGKSVNAILFVFATGLILIYMVLASQFNSFLQPVLVMLAQPLAIVGGVIALWVAGHTLNIYSMIGLVLLVGLVSKNSILLVDLINRYRNDGMDTAVAIREACPRRMRPVLMTSLTIVLAMLPAAVGVGEGAGQYGPLAVAVIGGVVSSTLLTLLVVPVAYSLMDRWLVRQPVAASRQG